MHVSPAKYRPVTFNQTGSGGATNLYMVSDTISNIGAKRANWWSEIEATGGNPTGTFQFRYNLTSDFPAATPECIINVMRGSVPSPANWNYVLTTTIAAAGGANGTITSSLPATLAPNAFILGEPVPVAASTTICSGNTSTLNVSSPTGNVSFNWYSASTGGTLLASNASYTTPVLNSTTTYYVEYFNTLTNCSSVRTPVNVNVNPTPVAAIGLPDSACVGTGQTVSFTGTATGTAAYNWNFNGGTVNSGSGAGPFNVTWNTSGIKTVTLSVTDNACVSNAASSQIAVGDVPTSTFTLPASACENQTINITYTGSSGPNATFSWNFNGANVTSGSGAGPYTLSWSTAGIKNITLTVSDYNCISALTTNTISIDPNPSDPIVSASNTTICQGDSTELTVTNSVAGITYNIFTTLTGGASIGSAPLWVQPGSTTSYYIEAVNNASSCVNGGGRTPITINVNDLPADPVITSTSNTICQGDSTQLTVTNAAAGVTNGVYAVASGGTPIGNAPLYVNPSSASTYYIEATTNASGCKNPGGRIPVNINVNPTPADPVVTVSNAYICSGDSSQLTVANASAGITYNVYTTVTGGVPIGQAPLYVQPASTTDYYVEAVNGATNCYNQAGRTLVTVNVNASPADPIPALSNDSICAGDSTEISVTNPSAGINYLIYTTSIGGTSIGQAPLYVSPANTNSYYIEAVNPSTNCGSTSGRVPISVFVNQLPAAPIPTTGASAVCAGDSTQIIVSNAVAGETYEVYSNATGVSTIGQAPLYVNPSTTTTYYVLAVSNASACTNAGGRVAVTVNVNSLPSDPIPVSDSLAICSGDSTVVSINTPVAGITYNLYLNATGGSPLGILPMNVGPSSTTTFYIEAVNPSTGCVNDNGRTPVFITVNPVPTSASVSVSNDTICSGSSATLTASGSTGGTIVYTFYDGANNPLGNSPLTVNPVSTTTYYLEVSNTFGCIDTNGLQPLTITVSPNPTNPVIAGNQSICEGDSTTLTASSQHAVSFVWTSDAAGTNIISNSPTLTVNPITTTSYYVFATSSFGCSTNQPASASVNVYPVPQVSLTSDAANNSIYIGQSITFTATSGYSTYTFFKDSQQISSGSNNDFSTSTVSDGQLFWVTATNGSCSANSDTIEVNVKPIANAFTPNGDGKNDLFLKGLDLTILNRWGQELYKGRDGWDGTFNGKLVSPGTYFYIVQVKNELDPSSDKVYNGPVTVIGNK
jgi:gliding motility-associated-like protein